MLKATQGEYNSFGRTDNSITLANTQELGGAWCKPGMAHWLTLFLFLNSIFSVNPPPVVL